MCSFKMRTRNVILIIGIVAVLPATICKTHAQTREQYNGVTKPQIAAIQNEKAGRSPAQQKMSSHLLDALKQKDSGQVSSSAPNLVAQPLTYTPEGDVMVDIKAKVSDELVVAIKDLGGRIVNKHPEYNAVRASMPLDKIERLAERADVQQVTEAAKGRANSTVAGQDKIAREGDIAHMANVVRDKFGLCGQNVKIGVLSDSIDDGYGALEDAYASNAMDRNKLSVLRDQDGNDQRGDGCGEGLAMAEIIHALAPDAQIYFATADGGPAQMAANIKELAKQGCQIIVDDYTYYNESPFQDGPISQAVNDVSSKGVLYFSSARNSGNKKQGTSGTWEGDFHDGGLAPAQYAAGGPNGRIHVFDTTKRITVNTADKASRGDRVDLFWSDPLGGSKNDYDLFVVNSAGQIVRSSTSNHTGQQDPYESVEPLRQGESIVIVKEGNAEARFLHLDTGRAVLRYSTNGSVRGHNASGASNAFSVAATKVPKPLDSFKASPNDSVESFSSDGPRRIFFGPNGEPLTPGDFSSSGGILLNKPDITAANRVSTTLSGSNLNPFVGTSAAAPHAAAIAALLLSCNPKPKSDEVRTALVKSALAIDGNVPNANAGYGVVMANVAMQIACPTTQQIPAISAEKGQPK